MDAKASIPELLETFTSWTGIKCDQTIKLKGFYEPEDYPDKQRDKTSTSLTNSLDLGAPDISLIYNETLLTLTIN